MVPFDQGAVDAAQFDVGDISGHAEHGVGIGGGFGHQ
jgi:hypothetical protein